MFAFSVSTTYQAKMKNKVLLVQVSGPAGSLMGVTNRLGNL